MASSGGGTLVEVAVRVLEEPDPFEKARIGEEVAIRWLRGDISLSPHRGGAPPAPNKPARLDTVKLLPSHLMPKLGKGGSLRSRQAMLHSLVHTESWAIDLSWDIVARFGVKESMPLDFFTDFVKVARDEGRHFTLLASRLRELGCSYGDFPAHDGLWESAVNTSHHLLARLAIEHCVHEARGLDVLPTTISRFRNAEDENTAKLLETVVYPEEVTHCAAGVKWFRYLCLRGGDDIEVGENRQPRSSGSSCTQGASLVCGPENDDRVIPTFHAIVRRYFRGSLKPPFNRGAREAAGFLPEWYEPLAVKVAELE